MTTFANIHLGPGTPHAPERIDDRFGLGSGACRDEDWGREAASVLNAPIFRRLSLAALLAAALAGCARNSGDRLERGRVVVDYWEKWSGFEAEAMQAVVDDFNRSQDRIEVRFLSVSQVDLKLLLAASSGHPPDVAGLWSENLPDFSEKGALTPLDPGLAKAGIGAEHYIPLFWDLCRHRGHVGPSDDPGMRGALLQQEALPGGGPRPREAAADLRRVRGDEPAPDPRRDRAERAAGAGRPSTT
jgi:hypothetical protein